MSTKWDSATIGDTCEILDNRRKPVTKSDRVQGQIPYYGASGILDYVKDYIFDEKLVLLGEDGAKWSTGDRSAFIIEGKAWVNNHAHVLRPNREILLDEWLTYFLVGSDLSDYISGVTVPKLNQGKMREIELPLPPLDEQKRIVAKLDETLGELDQVTENSKIALDQIQALWKAFLLASFDPRDSSGGSGAESWKEHEFSDVIDVYQPVTISTKKLVPDGPHLVYGANGVIGRYSDFNHEESELLMTCRGATCGALTTSEPKSWINGNAMVVRPKQPDLDKEFVFYALLGGLDIESAITGTAQPQITRASLAKLLIKYPPLSEQKRIVEKLGVMNKELAELKNLMQKMLQESVNLRSLILNAAFVGDF